MRNAIFLIILSLALFHNVRTQAGGFNQQYQPQDPIVANGTNIEGEIEMSFNYIDSPLTDIVWCGENRTVLFLLSEKNSIYRSVDDGFTGHLLTDHLVKLGKKEVSGTKGEVGQVSRILQSPVDMNMMIFLGTEGVNWITEDCGANIRAMNQGRKVEEFQFHPSERTWVLASAWTLCEDFLDEPCRKYKELFISKDLGENWDLIADYVFQFAWGQPDLLVYNIPKERVIIAHEPKGKGHQKLSGWSERLQVSYSDDFFKTTKVLVRGGNKFLLTSFFLFVVQVNDEDSQEVTLLSGNSRDKEYTYLKPIELPHKHLLEHSYTILDTSEHTVFLHINHEGERGKFGNIYVSDSTGIRYTLSLLGNVRNIDGQCDFERVQGLEGIYLANIYDRDVVKKYKNMETDNVGLPHQTVGTKKTSDPNFYQQYNPDQGNKGEFGAAALRRELDDSVKTVISFDKGGMWEPLTPPVKDSEDKRIICEDETCSLHLHSISSFQFGPFYTTESSRGLILGTGNVGTYLSKRPDEINTYLSRDGGLNWFEVAKGSHIYEIGDHGSIIVMASDQHSTTEVKYSWNEGLTWETLTVSEVPIEITNIIIEPSNTAEKFIIYGRLTDHTNRGIVIAADFYSLHQRWCEHHDKPDTPESDYETWTPNGKISSDCLLGRSITYVRKKREAECFNSEEYDSWEFIKNCECTEEDWECDFGYYRKDNLGACVSYDGKEANYSVPDTCNGYYPVTQGYRKVAGDSCMGGINHEAIKVPCPGLTSLNPQNLSILLLLVAIILSLVWLSNSANSDKIKDLFGGVAGNVGKMFARKPSSKRNGRDGFVQLDEIPDTLRDEEAEGRGDEDEEYGKITFVDDDRAEAIEDVDLLETVKGKRRTEAKAYEQAQKRVPALHKPGTKKNDFNPRDE